MLQGLCGLIAVAVTMGCGERDENVHSSGQASGTTCSEGSTLTYENFARDFMQRYCTRCHAASLASSERNGAPSDHDFDTLEGLRKTHAEHIDELRPHRLAQLKRFFEDYKKLEEKEVKVEEFLGPEEAIRTVAEAIERYADKFPGSW